MPMTQLECFKSTVNHKKHEGILFYAIFTPDLERRVRKAFDIGPDQNLFEHFGMFTLRDEEKNVSPRPMDNPTDTDYSVYYKDIEIPENVTYDFLGVLRVPGSMYHFTRRVSPLRNARTFEEIKSFPYPNTEGFSVDHMESQVRELHQRGYIAASLIGHMYEDSWQIRGYEQFLLDMAIRPEWSEYILDRIRERNLKAACAAARAGVDVIITGDDVANQKNLMFSIDQWRKFMSAPR